MAMEGLQSQDLKTKLAAIEALGDIGNREAVPALKNLYFQTADVRLKNPTKIALVKLGINLKELEAEEKRKKGGKGTSAQ